MDVTPKRLLPPVLSAVFLLLSFQQQPCLAQTTSPNASIATSALPDAPEPQNVTKPSQTQPNSRQGEPEDITLVGTPKRLLNDQKAIWTSPLHLKPSDGIWLVPFGVATGMLIGSDPEGDE